MKVPVLKGESTKDIDIDVKLDTRISTLAIGILSRVVGQNTKQGTKHAKGRSEVRGRAAKPFKQKGTGNARQGSRKGPHMRGGGISHGPQPDYKKLSLNRKFKNVVTRKLISMYLNEGDFGFIDLNDDVKGLRKSLSGAKSLVVYSTDNSASLKAIQNLPKLKVLNISSLSPLNLLNFKKVYFDIDVKDKVLEILKTEKDVKVAAKAKK